MKKPGRILRTVALSVVVLGTVACAGTPDAVEEDALGVAAIEERPESDPGAEGSSADDSTREDPGEATRSGVDDGSTDFSPEEVTEELYNQTFNEVEDTIDELNEIIANRDFLRWQSYLTDDYSRTFSNPRVLEESSRSAILQRNNITLRSLEDYFRFVVVPSRANVRLDEIVFVDESTVEAIMEVGGERYLVYNLTKSGDRWKIDTF